MRRLQGTFGIRFNALRRGARTCVSVSLQEPGDRGGEAAPGTSQLHSPTARDAILRGWGGGFEEYRRDLKRVYAQFEEPGGWGGPEVTELREEKRERALAALLRRTRKTDREALEAAKSAKWKIRIARELRSTSTATNAWIAERLAMGHPTRVCNLIRATCKI